MGEFPDHELGTIRFGVEKKSSHSTVLLLFHFRCFAEREKNQASANKAWRKSEVLHHFYKYFCRNAAHYQRY